MEARLSALEEKDRGGKGNFDYEAFAASRRRSTGRGSTGKATGRSPPDGMVDCLQNLRSQGHDESVMAWGSSWDARHPPRHAVDGTPGRFWCTTGLSTAHFVLDMHPGVVPQLVRVLCRGISSVAVEAKQIRAPSGVAVHSSVGQAAQARVDAVQLRRIGTGSGGDDVWVGEGEVELRGDEGTAGAVTFALSLPQDTLVTRIIVTLQLEDGRHVGSIHELVVWGQAVQCQARGPRVEGGRGGAASFGDSDDDDEGSYGELSPTLPPKSSGMSASKPGLGVPALRLG
jgi:hypothetical protein